MDLMISYSHKNSEDRTDLEKHLAVLKEKKDFSAWSDVNILPGEKLNEEIDKNIYTANIICLLLSAEKKFLLKKIIEWVHK